MENLQKPFLLVNDDTGFTQVLRNLFGREEEIFDLLVEYPLKVNEGDLVPAGMADIFGGV